MYAILQHGGHQYRVAPGDRLLVNRLTAEVGAVIALEPVIFLQNKEGEAGSHDVDGTRVAATVVAHLRGPKLRIFKYKPKKRYRRTMGYRSDLTELRIESMVARGQALPAAKPAVAPAEKPAKSRTKVTAPAVKADLPVATTKPTVETETPADAAGEE